LIRSDDDTFGAAGSLASLGFMQRRWRGGKGGYAGAAIFGTRGRRSFRGFGTSGARRSLGFKCRCGGGRSGLHFRLIANETLPITWRRGDTPNIGRRFEF